jgi:DNA-binding MarR family transcriptional regulator
MIARSRSRDPAQGAEELSNIIPVPPDASQNAEVPVSFGVLGDSIGFRLRRVQLTVMGEAIAALAPLGLRPAQFSILVLIDANPDLPQSKLSAALSIRRPNFVAMLHELESRGLTRRCVSSGDRRINTLALTAEGRRLLHRANELHAAYESRLNERLSAQERAELARLLARLE